MGVPETIATRAASDVVWVRPAGLGSLAGVELRNESDEAVPISLANGSVHCRVEEQRADGVWSPMWWPNAADIPREDGYWTWTDMELAPHARVPCRADCIPSYAGRPRRIVATLNAAADQSAELSRGYLVQTRLDRRRARSGDAHVPACSN